MSETQVEQDAAGAVKVTRTISAPVLRVWETLVGPAGAEALLGTGAHLGSKGQSWQSEEGHRGVVRSYHPMEQLRFSWHESADAPNSLVAIDLRPDGDATAVDLEHDRVSGDVAAAEQRWHRALERFESAVLA